MVGSSFVNLHGGIPTKKHIEIDCLFRNIFDAYGDCFSVLVSIFMSLIRGDLRLSNLNLGLSYLKSPSN